MTYEEMMKNQAMFDIAMNQESVIKTLRRIARYPMIKDNEHYDLIHAAMFIDFACKKLQGVK
jgi:hypothetical protein